MKVQEKRYMERVKSDLKILKDVSCSVELVGESKGKKIRKSVYVKAFCILDNKIVVGFDVKKVQLRRTQLTFRRPAAAPPVITEQQSADLRAEGSQGEDKFNILQVYYFFFLGFFTSN